MKPLRGGRKVDWRKIFQDLPACLDCQAVVLSILIFYLNSFYDDIIITVRFLAFLVGRWRGQSSNLEKFFLKLI